MNYPTAEQVRVAVQLDLIKSGEHGVVATVNEASHGINGPVYAVAFSEALEQEAKAEPVAEPAT